jgi:hypothetical protein
MTQQEKDEALDRLQRLLSAREGKDGYSQNVAAIRREIEALKAQPVSE